MDEKEIVDFWFELQDRAYWRADYDKLKKVYLKALPYLSQVQKLRMLKLKN